MRVEILYFAILRERARCARETLELPDGADVSAARAAVAERHPEIAALLSRVQVAVNRTQAPDAQRLADGDEVALLPPVAGGAGPRKIAIVDRPLLVDETVAAVSGPNRGGVVTFTGVVRRQGHHLPDVVRLEYEAYAEMALEQMRGVVLEAIARHGLCAAAAEHRVGVVPLSEASVLVAVSAPHRAEAFAGGREIIDRLKQLAPIWKRERDAAGAASWVPGAAPPAPGRATQA